MPEKITGCGRDNKGLLGSATPSLLQKRARGAVIAKHDFTLTFFIVLSLLPLVQVLFLFGSWDSLRSSRQSFWGMHPGASTTPSQTRERHSILGLQKSSKGYQWAAKEGFRKNAGSWRTLPASLLAIARNTDEGHSRESEHWRKSNSQGERAIPRVLKHRKRKRHVTAA